MAASAMAAAKENLMIAGEQLSGALSKAAEELGKEVPPEVGGMRN